MSTIISRVDTIFTQGSKHCVEKLVNYLVIGLFQIPIKMSDKKRKSEKQKSFKKRRKQTHKPLQDYTGIRGILFTCPAQREREAKTEALNLVQEVLEYPIVILI